MEIAVMLYIDIAFSPVGHINLRFVSNTITDIMNTAREPDPLSSSCVLRCRCNFLTIAMKTLGSNRTAG